MATVSLYLFQRSKVVKVTNPQVCIEEKVLHKSRQEVQAGWGGAWRHLRKAE
jgi:hypothetical protein